MSTSIQIPVNKLLICAQKVVGVIENQQTMPILTHVLIEINNQQLKLTATDSEIELQATESLDDSVKEVVNVTVLGKKLLEICRYLPPDSLVQMSIHKSSVMFKVDDSQFKLASLPACEFPKFENEAEQIKFSMPESKLLSLLKKTAFAMAHTDVRYYLNGLLFELNGDQIVAVATDGHRLAVNSIAVEHGFGHQVQSIIPRKAVLEMIRLLEPEDGSVDIAISAQDIHVSKQGLRFSSKLIDGRFPDYKRAMPRFDQSPIQFDKILLKKALSRIIIMSNDKIRGVNMDVYADRVRLSTNTPDLGEAEEVLHIEECPVGELKIGFNASYMIDVLNTIPSDGVLLSLQDADSSILLEATDDSSGRYIIMPMRL